MKSTNDDMPDLNIPEHVNLSQYYLQDRLSEGFADKTAIRYGEHQYSYSTVATRTDALARYLLKLGIRSEERVLVVLPDSPAFAWSFFAPLQIGAVIAMGNPYAPTENIEYLLRYTRASLLITIPSVLEGVTGTLKSCDNIQEILIVPDTATGEDCEASCELPEVLGEGVAKVVELSSAVERGAAFEGRSTVQTHRHDVAMWLFTSGSTGEPKAAVHTHADFIFNTELYAKQVVEYRESDVTISVPKLFFGYATGTNLMFPFAVGATSCMFSERPTPESLSNAVHMYRPTIVTNVPTMMAKLLEYDRERVSGGKEGLDFSTVRFHLSAGEALPPALLSRFQERFGAEVYDGIGSAEMFHIYISNRPGDVQPGSLGRIVKGYEAKILPHDASGPGAPELEVGEVGVLWVKGDSVALGYHQDREKSWKTFYGHWCRTGDLFSCDENGYFWFAGRADDLFKVGGIWVSPLEVEDCLLEHPAVAMAAVIPAEYQGLKKPKAYIVVREPVRERLNGQDKGLSLSKELQEYVKGKLSKHKYPRWIEFCDELPKNDRGKINRRALQSMHESGERV